MIEKRIQRLDELLFARATEGLDADAAVELERLLAEEPHADVDRYDRAAAAVCLAVLGGSSMPPELRANVEQQLLRARREQR